MRNITIMDELQHMEEVHDEYFETLDKAPTEDKLLLSREEALAPWEISEIVQNALGKLPEDTEEHLAIIFDVIYEAISEALDSVRGFVK